MIYSPKPFERLLTLFIARQTKAIEKLIDQFIYDASSQTERTLPDGLDEGQDFFFRDYPALSRKVDVMLKGLAAKITSTIVSGSEWSWSLANEKNDNMLSKVLASIGEGRVSQSIIDRWSQKNLPALQAFEDRRLNGLGLSGRVWNYAKGIKGDLELALDIGLGEGASADRLSRLVRSYLREPTRLYRRVRDEKGELRLSKSAANYHPGQGVYRSAYKNARRLAATETNMAYRTSDYDRMQEMDFILGYEVHLSNNHTCLDSHGVPQPFHDICDELQGKYPKWFVFRGWHPLCRCYVTTILPDKDEMMKYIMAMDENGVSSYQFDGYIEDLPPQFKEWMGDNYERMLDANSLPYFIQDNPQIFSQGVLDLDDTDRKALAGKVDAELGAKAGLEQERAGIIPDADVKSATRVREIEENLSENTRIAMAKALEVGPEVQGIAEGIADKYGATVTPINYKSAASIKRKCRNELEYPQDLKDTVRTTIVASKEQIPSVIADLQKQAGFMRWKQQTPERFDGYSGNIVNIRMGNGVIAEIQVNTPEMIYAKNKPASAVRTIGQAKWDSIYEQTGLAGGLGHKYYEKIRVLPGDSAERLRLVELMRAYYSFFR